MEGKHLKPQKDRRNGLVGKRGNGKTGMGARALMYAKVFHVENPHLAAVQQPQQWRKNGDGKKLHFANTF